VCHSPHPVRRPPRGHKGGGGGGPVGHQESRVRVVQGRPAGVLPGRARRHRRAWDPLGLALGSLLLVVPVSGRARVTTPAPTGWRMRGTGERWQARPWTCGGTGRGWKRWSLKESSGGAPQVRRGRREGLGVPQGPGAGGSPAGGRGAPAQCCGHA